MTGGPSLPEKDGLVQPAAIRHGDKSMQVIGHQKKKFREPVFLPVIKPHRVEERTGYVRMAKLIAAPFGAADGDEPFRMFIPGRSGVIEGDTMVKDDVHKD